MNDPHLSQLIRSVAGNKAAEEMLGTLAIDRTFLLESAGAVSRGAFAMALNAVLFHDLLARTPTGAAYVADRRRQGERVVLDHGALRSVRFALHGTGALPPGAESFSRILQPLGYHGVGTYPHQETQSTGTAFAHREFAESLPQFWVREVHVERFSKEFQAAAERVFGSSRDPLTAVAHAALGEFAEHGRCELRLAASALRELVAAFGRRHETPALADYRLLLAESPDCAWIATEGSAFAHAADRVTDVAMTACAQRSLGRPVQATIITSAAGSVRLTAFKPDPVRRTFRADDGADVDMTVPGSYYEFVSRDCITGPDGKRRMDLRLNTGDAPEFFKKTAVG